MTEPLVSIETAMALVAFSRRTLWRRIADGLLRKGEADSKGRTMLSSSDVLAACDPPLPLMFASLLSKADAGCVESMSHIALEFKKHGNHSGAIIWWQRAANLGCSDSMQHLGAAFASGTGVDKNRFTALMWLNKAAAHGHVIAIRQLQQ